ncbi:NAD(P)H-dependent glycerol-3-phosphate dehydrogenase [Dolosicoccus paucivorans]|uniref:NAD(P)H-dependent glycerol-3-phosphate dehydrogenase n=1 Tax=Dolosicoccus paucivorans TaxID=84521 RepID=UPI0008927B3F|nr:NAD(P)H-dependent glycerol-3-phosphate dehydrogenase [Dolosicoccus paucivorans]SDI70573.1 glycerol-3-phosphate dehydrogenase (NAD(P)+) [Dolosicoccus paucivorans]
MKIAVLGTGSWGTALAKLLCENGHQVCLWGRRQEVVDEINQQHTNDYYLQNTPLPKELKATTDLKEAVLLADYLLIVVPTQAIRPLSEQLVSLLKEKEIAPVIIHSSKGLEQGTHLRISQIIQESIPSSLYQEVAVLSGPSHAEEVVKKDLTTVTIACTNLEVARDIQQLFMNDYFRVYTNQDIIGVEMGAALKNIIAVAAGLIKGLGYGDNALAGLVTRGLAEMTRLGVALGAAPLTFSGLSGIGDLIVTATSPHSRNWQAGKLLAEGYSKEAVSKKIGMIVEGIWTTKAAYELSAEYQVEMPITYALYGLLYEDLSVEEGVRALMMRSGKQEASIHTPEKI